MPESEPKIGRPTLCTPERTQAIAALVRGGVFGEVAAQANGVTRTAYYGWMARGRAAIAREAEGVEVPAIEQAYVDFLVAIETADATAEATATLHLMKAMPGAPIALVQYLERRHGRRWSRPEPQVDRPGPATFDAADAPATSWRAIDEPQATSWRAGQGGMPILPREQSRTASSGSI